MKKIDFSKVMIEYRIGEPEPADVRHVLGNAINQKTGDIALADFARTIYYSDGPVEVPDEYVEPIVAIVHNSEWIAPAKTAVIRILSDKTNVKPPKK